MTGNVSTCMWGNSDVSQIYLAAPVTKQCDLPFDESGSSSGDNIPILRLHPEY